MVFTGLNREVHVRCWVSRERGLGLGGQSGPGQQKRKAQLGYVPLRHHVPHPVSYGTLLCWPCQQGHTSGVSELHLRSKLGPTVGPAEAVMVMDVVEPMGETHGGHQQGDA